MQECFWLIDQENAFPADGRVQEHSRKATHPVALCLKHRQCLDLLYMLVADSILTRARYRTLTYVQWNLISSDTIHNKINAE
jgi:hypothetical protein